MNPQIVIILSVKILLACKLSSFVILFWHGIVFLFVRVALDLLFYDLSFTFLRFLHFSFCLRWHVKLHIHGTIESCQFRPSLIIPNYAQPCLLTNIHLIILFRLNLWDDDTYILCLDEDKLIRILLHWSFSDSILVRFFFFTLILFRLHINDFFYH